MQEINDIHHQRGLHRSLMPYHVDGKIFGWTAEQLGWNFTPNGVVRGSELGN